MPKHARRTSVWMVAIAGLAVPCVAQANRNLDDIVGGVGPGAGPAGAGGGATPGDLAAAVSPVGGSLGAGDRTLRSGEFIDVMPFTGRGGQRLVVRMVSTEFDAYLMVRSPSGEQWDDDDGGKGTHARLDIELPEDGTYQVGLTSARPGETGSYLLHVRSSGGRFASAAARGIRVTPGAGVLPAGAPGGGPISGGIRSGSQGFIQIQPGQGVVVLDPGQAPTLEPVAPPPVAPEPPSPEDLPEGVLLQPGTTTGTLEPGDAAAGDGHWVDLYSFDAREGQEVTLDLSSREFDTVIAVLPPSGGDALENDDRAQGNTDSWLSFTAPESGRYRVGVLGYRPDEIGAYTLRLSIGGAGAPTGPGTEPVTTGTPIRGSLESGDEQLATGEYIDWYPLPVEAGRETTIDLASDEFDTYLLLVTPSGRSHQNDDAGQDTTNARIALRLDEAGTYQIGVTSYQAGETGSYELRVATAEGSPPPPPTSDPGGLLTAGTSTSGELVAGDATLATGEFVDVYAFAAEAGQTVRVDMVSTAVDPYLIVELPSGRRVENDDVGPNDRNASVSAVVPQSGTVRVLCTTYRPGETGGYDVAVAFGEEAAAGPGPSFEAVPDQNREFFGVFVGISDYPAGVGDLPLCREDAEKLAATFKGIGLMDDAHIDLITDGRATETNVRNAMRRMASRVGPDDVFVFFYSGHGSQSDPQPQVHQDEVDGRQESIILGRDEYTDDEMAQDLDNIHAGLAVVALDSCFAGGFARDIVSRPGRVGFFSSEEDLTSNVAGEFQAGGYLSHFFQKAIEGYADMNRDGLVQIGELSHYLQDQYAEHVREATAETAEGAAGYQHLVVDRGAVRVDTLFFRAGRSLGGAPRTFGMGF